MESTMSTQNKVTASSVGIINDSDKDRNPQQAPTRRVNSDVLFSSAGSEYWQVPN